jgi:hypothetical protein
MIPDQPLTRKVVSRSLQEGQGSVAPALLGLLFLLLVLSLAGCSDLPSLVLREFDPAQVAQIPASPVTVSTEPVATAPAEPTDSREFHGSGDLVSVDAATGTNFDATTANHAVTTGDEDLGSVAAEDPVHVVGLVTPLGHARPVSGERDTLGVSERKELNAHVGAGVTAHALVADASFDEVGATLEAN